jgi:hypothetical protein
MPCMAQVDINKTVPPLFIYWMYRNPLYLLDTDVIVTKL